MLLLLMFQSKNSEYTCKTKKKNHNSQNLEFGISLFFITHMKSTVENTFKNKQYIISIYSKHSENNTSFTPIELLNLETPWLYTLDNLSEYHSCLVLNHNQWALFYKSICVLLINPYICIKPQFNHHSALLSTKVYSFKRLKKKTMKSADTCWHYTSTFRLSTGCSNNCICLFDSHYENSSIPVHFPLSGLVNWNSVEL